MSERTGSEIREYCEAASEGPWTASPGPGGGIDAPKDVMNELYRTGNFEANQHFSANARTDLPRVLEAAVKLWRQRYSDRTVIAHRRACALVKGRNITDEDIHRLVMQDTLLTETAWLADTKEEDTDGST